MFDTLLPFVAIIFHKFFFSISTFNKRPSCQGSWAARSARSSVRSGTMARSAAYTPCNQLGDGECLSGFFVVSSHRGLEGGVGFLLSMEVDQSVSLRCAAQLQFKKRSLFQIQCAENENREWALTI